MIATFKRCTLLTALLLLTAPFFSVPAVHADAEPIHIIVNGNAIPTSEHLGQPFISTDHRTMVPLRVINHYLGYQTEWNDGVITVVQNEKNIHITLLINDTTYRDGATVKQLTTAPVLVNDRTYLPLRDLGEWIGSVIWNGELRTVHVYPEKNMSLQYAIKDTELIRIDGDQSTSLKLSDRDALNPFTDRVLNHKIIDGKHYMIITQGNNHAQQEGLYRDDGKVMTRLATVNSTSPYYVLNNTVYHTDGTSRGPWSASIQPNRLHKTSLDNHATVSVLLDFPVNTCILIEKQGDLVALEESGTSHVIAP